ncbi:MAG: ribosomal protein S18-alanine N-acetyltransferase [Candidatus Zixiibacteriota bacterium]
MHIRPMRQEDVPAVALLEQTLFGDPWSETAFAECLTVASRINLVLVDDDGAVIGYVCAQCAADEMQIHNVAVAHHKQRRGGATLLLRAAEAEGRNRGALCAVLDVRVTNDAALSLYTRLGYRRIGRRRDYYRHPICDALVLFKSLADEASQSIPRELANGMVS